MNLKTTYLGLPLPHPIVCGASPLSADLDMVLRLEDERWCESQHCDSLAAVKGVAGLGRQGGLSRFERDEYVAVLQSWNRDHLPPMD